MQSNVKLYRSLGAAHLLAQGAPKTVFEMSSVDSPLRPNPVSPYTLQIFLSCVICVREFSGV